MNSTYSLVYFLFPLGGTGRTGFKQFIIYEKQWNSLKKKQEKNPEITYVQWSEICLHLEQMHVISYSSKQSQKR